MTLEEFGVFLNTKSVGRIEAPINENLAERVYTGMKYIAKVTMPLQYIVQGNPELERKLRRIDQNTWIRFPNKPIINDKEQLDIDEILLDALASYVMAGLETQRGKIHMAMFYDEINQYDSMLIENHLEGATNDAKRFHQFP